MTATSDTHEMTAMENRIAREYAENIVETVRESLLVLSYDLKIITANHSFFDTFKVTPAETIGNFIYDLGNRQWDIPKLRELLENILTHNNIVNGYEVEHDFIGIGRKHMLLNARQILHENLGSNIILLAIEDNTVRKQAELENQDAREYAENIVETIREPLLALTSDLRIITANQSFYDTFKVTPAETIGNFIYDLGNRQWDIPKLRELLENILTHNNIVNGYEVEHDFVGIGRKHMLLNARQISRKNIGSNIILLAIEDNTVRKQAEMSLLSEKERLRITLHSIGDGVITTDMFGKVVIMNEIAEQLCGWTNAEAEGKPLASVLNLINKNSRIPCPNPVEIILLSGRIIELSVNTVLISRDGSEKMIADSGAPIKDARGKVIGAVLVFRDITEKEKQSEIQQRNMHLESLGVLAGGIAHDFNNLLSIIYGYLEIMSENPSTQDNAEYIAQCLGTMKRAKAITGQLLTFAKGGAPIKKASSICPFIQNTVKFALSGSNCIAAFDIQNNILDVEYDENQMGQVYDNLIINAMQSMPDGGLIEISVKNVTMQEAELPALQPGEYVMISFRDTGSGMTDEVKTRIFDPYFTTKAKGHGLGLASVYSIIKKHEGAINVESKPEIGTVFDLYLPATKKHEDTSVVAPVPAIKSLGRILVMDDEEALRTVLMKMLQTLGYTSVGAGDGREVLEILTNPEQTKESFAAVILDLTISGGLGGYETVKEIRKFAPDLPVFVYSGYSDDPIIMNPQKYGFNGSLGKPFVKAEILKLLNSRACV